MSYFACAVCQKKSAGGKDDKESKDGGLLRCAGCQGVFYCSKECQKTHWKAHKATCNALQALKKDNKGYSKVIQKEGETGNSPKNGQEVFVHYTGTLPNGTVFDTSRKDGSSTPFSFHIGLGQVIQGWDEGVRTMNKGERATLYISADFAYGKDGRPPVIPPNSPLIFEVELLDFKTAELTKTGTNFL